MNQLHPEVSIKCNQARQAAPTLAAISTNIKNELLNDIANSLEHNIKTILKANLADLELLKKADGYTTAFYDRLMLNEDRIHGMAEGLREIALLDDPIGEVLDMKKRPNGLQIGRMRVPIGVVGIIYEARPNVTADAAGLALKAGNAVVLRGSSEAINSNKALVKIIQSSLDENRLPPGAVSLIEDTARSAAHDLMKASEYLDVLIPRGGPSLKKAVIENSTVPVIQTGAGNCHLYLDESADLRLSVEIAINAKVQRPGVCNAIETLLVHQSAAPLVLPKVIEALQNHGVEIRGCPATQKIYPKIKPANELDWQTEYLDLVIAIKVVDNIDQAIEHINNYGTGHSEAIITNDYNHSMLFLNNVDAAAIYVNASTRFTDGAEFGLGAEMGISTQKLHVRGPMGLEALTSIKYIIFGSGQIRK